MIRTNDDRAERARKCLLSEYNDNDLRTNIVDLICDLQHLADKEDLEFDGILWGAENHHYEEVREESS